MDEETKQWYENQFDLFQTQGFKDLREQVGLIIQNTEDIRKAKVTSLENLQGKLDILDWLYNWPATVEASFKELNSVSDAL